MYLYIVIIRDILPRDCRKKLLPRNYREIQLLPQNKTFYREIHIFCAKFAILLFRGTAKSRKFYRYKYRPLVCTRITMSNILYNNMNHFLFIAHILK